MPGPHWERWEVEGGEGAVFSWNREKEEFEFRGGEEDFGDEGLYERIGEAARKGLREQLTKFELKHFEVRPVVAVRRQLQTYLC